MSLTEQMTPDSSTYVHIQGKLAQTFSPNTLCKEWVIEWLAKNGYEKKALRITGCGRKAIALQCANGHQKRVRMTCHLEICPTCGEKRSLAHRKRYTRALDRLLWAPVLGYMVFTLPKEVSDSLPSKAELSKIEKEAVKIVKDNFNTPGCMVRAHLMGNEIEKLHIHVNVLFPIIDTNGTGRVSKETLDTLRKQWTEIVNKQFNLSVKMTNVFYKFDTNHRKMKHKIKYVTRAVVVAEKFLSLSNEAKHWYLSLSGWHNTRWYGKLANCKYKDYLKERGIDHTANREQDIALAKQCPVCSSKFRYIEVIPCGDIDRSQFRQIERDVWVDRVIFAVMMNKAGPPSAGTVKENKSKSKSVSLKKGRLPPQKYKNLTLFETMDMKP